MTRDQITQSMLAQQRQMPGRPLGSPFAPAPVPQQRPLVAGTPTPPIAAPVPQYGFETGYKAAAGPQAARPGGESEWAKKLKEMLFGSVGWSAGGGSGAP